MSAKRAKPAYDKALRPVPQPRQLGDWAAVLAVALFVGLWCAWPSAPPASGRRPSEPSCAYGVLSPDFSTGQSLGRFARRDDDAFTFARLPPVDLPPVPDPPAPVAAAVPPPTFPDAPRHFPAPVSLPPPPPFPFQPSAALRTGLVIRVSPGLTRAGFSLETPPDTAGTNAYALSARVSFGADGALESLLIDPSPAAGAPLTWRTALQLARTATNAVGVVEISHSPLSPPSQ